MAKRNPLREPVRSAGLTARSQHDQGVLDGQPIPEHPVDNVLRGVEHLDRVGLLKQVERGSVRCNVARFVFTLHPCSPPGGRPPEDRMLQGEPRQRPNASREFTPR